MKLLVDENLSPNLVSLLSDLFPGSEHIYEVGLGGATDTRLWAYARAGGFAILSKDNDFRQRAFVSGAPPKVIWLDVGNAGTAPIVELLRRSRLRIEELAVHPATIMMPGHAYRESPSATLRPPSPRSGIAHR